GHFGATRVGDPSAIYYLLYCASDGHTRPPDPSDAAPGRFRSRQQRKAGDIPLPICLATPPEPQAHPPGQQQRPTPERRTAMSFSMSLSSILNEWSMPPTARAPEAPIPQPARLKRALWRAATGPPDRSSKTPG